MKITKTIFLLLIIFTGFQSCYYDVEQELYPLTGECDTSNARLAAKVRPILEEACYTCHSQANSGLGGNINLETYSGTNCLQEVALNGKLINSINHRGPFPMPKASPKLEACKIKIIEAWVANGSKNN